MSAFNLTAQLNLRGPSNVKQIVSDIRKQLGTVTGDINLKVNPTATKNITQLNAALSTLNTNLSQVSANATSASSAISAFANAANSINKATTSTSSNINKTVASTNKLVQSQSAASKAISESTSEMQEFGKQSALAVRRFAAFSGATGVIVGLGGAIRKGLTEFIAYEKEFVKIQQVTDKTASQLKGLDQEIRKLSVGLGVSSSELIKVSSTLAQAGLSAKEAQQALQALALTDLAPSFDSLNETVEGSIALMRQFSIGAGELERALGSVNAVAAAFAVESSDLISAIQRTGGVFAAASKGVSEGTQALNEFLAVFTSVRQTTRESAETIATGLRTIFTRIQRADTIEALREYGIQLSDVEGKFVGAYRAVELLSKGLSGLDPRDIRFSQIVEELGGFRQIGKVIPLIQQFGVAQQALGVAQRGQASLARDALTAQLSLANQISKVREEFLALMRSVGSSDTFQTIAKSALGFTSVLLKVADSIKGLLPILAIVGIGKLSKGIGEFGTGFVGGLFKGGKGGGGGGNAPTNPGGIPPILGGGGGDAIPANLAQNLALLDDILVQNVDAINNLGTSLSGLTTALGSINSFSGAIQANTASLTSNTASIQALTTAISGLNLGGGAPGAPFNLGGTVKKFARGGVVPGTGNSDTVPAMLMPGEFVIRKKAVETIGADNLHSMNKYGSGGSIRSGRAGKRKRFARGGAAISSIDEIVKAKDGDTFIAKVTPKTDQFEAEFRVDNWDAWEKANTRYNPKGLSRVPEDRYDVIKNLESNKSKKIQKLFDNKNKRVPEEAFIENGQKIKDLAATATAVFENVVKNKDLKELSSNVGELEYFGRYLISGDMLDIDPIYKTGRTEFKSGGRVQKFMAGGKTESAPFGTGTTKFPKRISNLYEREMRDKVLKAKSDEIFGAGTFDIPKDERINIDESKAAQEFSKPFDRQKFMESFKSKIMRNSLYGSLANFAKFIGLPGDDLSKILPQSIDFGGEGMRIGTLGAFFTDAGGSRGYDNLDLSSYGFSTADEQDLYGYQKLLEEKKKEIAKILKTPVEKFDDGSFRYDEEAFKKATETQDAIKKSISDVMDKRAYARKAAMADRQKLSDTSGRGVIGLLGGLNGRIPAQNQTLYHELTHQLFKTLKVKQADSFTKYKDRVNQLFNSDNDSLSDAFDALPGSYSSADIVYGRYYKNNLLNYVLNTFRSKTIQTGRSPDPDFGLNGYSALLKSEGTKKAREYKPINPQINDLLLKGGIEQTAIDKAEDSGKEEFLTTLIETSPSLDSNLQQILDSTINELLSNAGIQRQRYGIGGEVIKRGGINYSVKDITAAAERNGMTFEQLKAKLEERKVDDINKDYVMSQRDISELGLFPYRPESQLLDSITAAQMAKSDRISEWKRRQGIRDKDYEGQTSEQKEFLSSRGIGYRKRYAAGGVVTRNIGVIDTDVLRDPANADVVGPAMEKLGISSVSEYSVQLAKLSAQARKEQSLSKLTAIAGAAGSGKSSLAMGRGAPDDASLRKTVRSSILTPEDIAKVNEIIVLTSTASQEKLDAYLKEVDRAYILSSSTTEEQDKIGANRTQRDLTGEGLYGRRPGITNMAPRDFTLEESILRDELGKKAMVLGRKPGGFGLRRKTEEELPEIVQAGGYYTGGFAPPTRGHRGAFDTLLSNMIAKNPNASAEDIIVSVAPNLSMDRGEGDTEAEQLAHAARYGIFPADFRALLAGINFPGGMISTESTGRGDVLPKMMEVQGANGRRKFAKLKGALAITSGKEAGALQKYEKAGVEVTDIPRIDDISATKVRQAVINGDDKALTSFVSPEVASVLMGNRAQLRNRSMMVPMLIEEIKKYGANQKAQTNAEIQQLLANAPGGPYGKNITQKVRENAPDVVAQIEAMREQRDALSSSLLGYRAHNIISLLSAKYPDAYALDPSRRASVSAQPADLAKDTILAQLSEGMAGEFGGVSTAMPSGLQEAILKNVEKTTQVKKSSGILPAQGSEILKRFGADRLPTDASFGPFSGKTVRDTAEGGKLKYWNSAFRPETKADKLAYYTATRDYLIDKFNESQGTQKATALAETTNAVLSSKQLGLVGLNPLGYTGLLGPETWNLGVDPSGQQRSIDASIVQRGLPIQYQNVIDYLSGRTEEIVGGASKLLGIEPKKLTKKQRETLGQGNIEGALLEQIFGSADATILDDALRTRPIDFPMGIGPKAAEIFGIDPDIPTEVKRTIDSTSRGKAVEEFQKYFRQQYGIPDPEKAAAFAAGGKVKLYHGSNTGIDDAVLKSFKEKGALSNIATGYGQGAGFYLYTEKSKAEQQAKMRVNGGSNFTLASGDRSGKPMVLSFDEILDPKTFDLDYELQKGLVVQWIYDNYDTLKDKYAPSEYQTGLKGKLDKNPAAGLMSVGIRVQEGSQTLKSEDGTEFEVKGGSRKSIYAGSEGDVREGALLGQLMNRIKAGDTELMEAFESKLFEKPLGLALKYVGSSPLSPTNIETFAYGGRAGISPEDTVPALLTPGEFVINKDAAQKIGYSKLQKLNQADKLQGYNSGGLVRRYAAGTGGGGVPGGGPGGGSGSPLDPAAKAAADALSYFALQAEYYGKSVGEYQKSLKQQIVERALAMRQEMPKNITSFKIKANQLRGVLEAPDSGSATVPKEVSNARDELKKLLSSVAGPSMDDDALANVVEDLETRIESGLSFDEAIAATDSLTRIFKNASDTGEQYTRVLEEFSTATGVAQEELEKIASFDDVTAAQTLNEVSEAGNKLFSRLTKLGGAATFAAGILGKLLESEGSKTSRVLSAGIQGGVGTAAQGLAYGQATFTNLSSIAKSESLPSSVTSLAGGAAEFMTSGVGLAFGGVAIAAVGVAAALKDAANAAREFDIERANKSIDESLQRVSNYFTDFAKDIKNTNILTLIEQELVQGVGSAIASVKLQTEVPKTFWANLIDSLSNGDAASAERSRILEQQGVGAYSETTAFAQNPVGFILQGLTLGFGDALLQSISGGNLGLGVGPNSAAQQAANQNIEYYTTQAAPQLAQQRAQTFQPVAENILKLGEEQLRSKVSDLSDVLNQLGSSTAPTQFAQALARSNPLIEEQIIRIQASTRLSKDEKESQINNIIAIEAEYKARLRFGAVLKELDLDKLNKDLKVFTTSVARILNNMDMSVGKATYNIDQLASAADLTNKALSGAAEIGNVSLKSINVLQNQRAYSREDNVIAASQASGMFGSVSDPLNQLIGLGDTLETTVLKAINDTIANREGASPEAISGAVRASLNTALNDIGLPPELSEKMSKQVQNAFAELRTGEDKKLSFAELVEKIPQFAETISTAKDVQQSAIKALEFWQNQVNNYAKAMNQAMEYQLESNDRFRKSTDIRIKSEEDLSKALGKPITLLSQRQNTIDRTASLTGGLTNAGDIGQNILRLNNVRATQQDMISGAAGGGPENYVAIEKMTRNLNQTNLALRENYQALKDMADSSDEASAALAKINEAQQKNQAGQNIIEKLVTSNAVEINRFNKSLGMLNNNMAGGINNSTPDERSQVLQTFNMIAPLLGEQQNPLKANVLESLLKESGIGINGLFADVITSLRSPETDPNVAEALQYYKDAISRQTEANRILGELQALMAKNTSESAGLALAGALEVKFSNEEILLKDIKDGINKLVNIAGAAPGAQARANGGIIYADGGALVNFQPRGTDTVPAMLTPGEFVVNKKATQKNLPLLKNINSGKTSYYAFGGVVGGVAVGDKWSKDGNSDKDIATALYKRLNDIESDTNANDVTKEKFLKLKNPGDVPGAPSRSVYASPLSFYAVAENPGKIELFQEPQRINDSVLLNKVTAAPGASYKSIYKGIGLTAGYIDPGNNVNKFLNNTKDLGKITNLNEFNNLLDINTLPQDNISMKDIKSYLKTYDQLIRNLETAEDINKKVKDQNKENQIQSQTITAQNYFKSHTKLVYDEAPPFGPHNYITDLAYESGGSNLAVLSYSKTDDKKNTNSYPLLGFDSSDNPVGGSSLMHRASIRNQAEKSTVGLDTTQSAAVHHDLSKLIDLREDARKSYDNLKNANLEFVETQKMASQKGFTNNLNAFYEGKAFKTVLNSDFVKSNPDYPDAKLPLTIYNMDEQEWKDYILKYEATVPEKDGFRNIRYPAPGFGKKNFLTLKRYSIIPGKNPGDPIRWSVPGGKGEKYPWTSGDFNDKGITDEFEKKFYTDRKIKILSAIDKTYGDTQNGTGKFSINYKEIEGKLFDSNTGKFGDTPVNYVVVDPTDNGGFNPGSPLGEIPAGRLLVAKDFNSILKILNNTTPSYDLKTGKVDPKSAPGGATFRYLFGKGTGSGLISSNAKTKQMLEQSAEYASLGKDLQRYVVSAQDAKSWDSSITDDYEIVSGKYKDARAQRILDRDKILRKEKASTVSGDDLFKLKDSLSEEDKKAGMNVGDLESFSPAKRVTLARYFYDKYGKDFSIRSGKPTSVAGLIKIANELNSYSSDVSKGKEGQYGADWNRINALRAIFTSLAKPEDSIGTYFKRLGFPLKNKDYKGRVPVAQDPANPDRTPISYYEGIIPNIDSVMELLLQRESDFSRATKNVEGPNRYDLYNRDELRQNLQNSTDNFSLSEIKDGRVVELKDKQKITAFADVEQIALNPYNLPSQSSDRQNLLNELAAFYQNDKDKNGDPIWPEKRWKSLGNNAVFGDKDIITVDDIQNLAPNGLRDWYAVQDNILNKSKNEDQLRAQSDEVYKAGFKDSLNKIRDASQDWSTYLTGNLYGLLPDWDWISNKLGLMEPKENVAAAAADPNILSKGGMVYASEGQYINFQPRGTDTVPAMLTPGEFVVNRASTSKNLPLLQAINKSKGGSVSYFQNGGPVGAADSAAVNNGQSLNRLNKTQSSALGVLRSVLEVLLEISDNISNLKSVSGSGPTSPQGPYSGSTGTTSPLEGNEVKKRIPLPNPKPPVSAEEPDIADITPDDNPIDFGQMPEMPLPDFTPPEYEPIELPQPEIPEIPVPDFPMPEEPSYEPLPFPEIPFPDTGFPEMPLPEAIPTEPPVSNRADTNWYDFPFPVEAPTIDVQKPQFEIGRYGFETPFIDTSTLPPQSRKPFNISEAAQEAGVTEEDAQAGVDAVAFDLGDSGEILDQAIAEKEARDEYRNARAGAAASNILGGAQDAQGILDDTATLVGSDSSTMDRFGAGIRIVGGGASLLERTGLEIPGLDAVGSVTGTASDALDLASAVAQGDVAGGIESGIGLTSDILQLPGMNNNLGTAGRGLSALGSAYHTANIAMESEDFTDFLNRGGAQSALGTAQNAALFAADIAPSVPAAAGLAKLAPGLGVVGAGAEVIRGGVAGYYDDSAEAQQRSAVERIGFGALTGDATVGGAGATAAINAIAGGNVISEGGGVDASLAAYEAGLRDASIGAAVGTAILPGIGTAVGATAGYATGVVGEVGKAGTAYARESADASARAAKTERMLEESKTRDKSVGDATYGFDTQESTYVNNIADIQNEISLLKELQKAREETYQFMPDEQLNSLMDQATSNEIAAKEQQLATEQQGLTGLATQRADEANWTMFELGPDSPEVQASMKRYNEAIVKSLERISTDIEQRTKSAEDSVPKPTERAGSYSPRFDSYAMYRTGGIVYASEGQMINFQPQGTDTVPAMLTPGEFVINRNATAKHFNLLQSINSGSYSYGDIAAKFNTGGYVSPNYYQAGSYVSPMLSRKQDSFDFAGFMQKLMGQLSSVISEALRESIRPANNAQNIDNRSNGVSIDTSILDRINEFTNRLKSVADTLAGLNAIPSEIKITGKHDINVVINGDSALNQLRPELQQLVMNEIKSSFQRLINQNSPLPADKLINPFDSNLR